MLLHSVSYAISAYNNHFPPKKKFGHVKIWPHVNNHFALWISILHNMLCIPSCLEGLKVLFYSWNHVIWSSFELDTVQKPLFSYFLQG